MAYKIKIGEYSLSLLDQLTIRKSITSLEDSATIVVPAYYHNRTFNIEENVKVGDAVSIKIGYGTKEEHLKEEFVGYVDKLTTEGGNITIECLDAMYLLKHKEMENGEHKNITVKSLLQKVADACGLAGVSSEYEFTYSKFTIHNATAYVVLKKLQEEAKADVYIKDNVLHFNAPYSKVLNEGEPVLYDFARNIESSDLKYKNESDSRLQIELTYTDSNGKKVKKTFGKEGGEKKTFKAGTVNTAEMEEKAKQIYDRYCFTGYEGGFTGWLLPYVEPTMSVKLNDSEYPDKNGVYYVAGTEVEFSSSGGRRKITLGRRLS